MKTHEDFPKEKDPYLWCWSDTTFLYEQSIQITKILKMQIDSLEAELDSKQRYIDIQFNELEKIVFDNKKLYEILIKQKQVIKKIKNKYYKLRLKTLFKNNLIDIHHENDNLI